MSFTRRRFYKTVAANFSEVDEYVPPAGEFRISEVGGNAGISPSTIVKIIWDYGGDEQLLMSTHGDTSQEVKIAVTADGVKKIAIVLINDQAVSDSLGGFWKGK